MGKKQWIVNHFLSLISLYRREAPSVTTSAGLVVSPRPKSSEITKAEATQEVMESGAVTSKSWKDLDLRSGQMQKLQTKISHNSK